MVKVSINNEGPSMHLSIGSLPLVRYEGFLRTKRHFLRALQCGTKATKSLPGSKKKGLIDVCIFKNARAKHHQKKRLDMVKSLWEDKRLDSCFHSRFPGEIAFHSNRQYQLENRVEIRLHMSFPLFWEERETKRALLVSKRLKSRFGEGQQSSGYSAVPIRVSR